MLNENNLIEKSKPLIWAKFNDYTVNELKLLEVYLSRINARNPESSLVTFTKKEYCELMGLHVETKTRQLKKYVNHFLGNVVSLDFEGGWRSYTLFTEAICELDDEIGMTVIKIDCNPKLKGLFFNLAEDGYARYKLRNIINLKSQYSVRLYSMLKDRAFGNYQWKIDLPEFRSLMCINAPRYESFKFLNSEILKKCQTEINENTDIRFTYERIVKGRLTRGLIFKITQLNEDNLPGQMNIYDYPQAFPGGEEEYNKDDFDNFSSVVYEACECEFNAKQCKELSVLALPHTQTYPGNMQRQEQELFDYVQKKYVEMNAKDGVINRYAYLKALVENNFTAGNKSTKRKEIVPEWMDKNENEDIDKKVLANNKAKADDP